MKTVMQSTKAVALKDKVLEELKWDPSVNEAEIGIVVRDGVVALIGTVGSWAEKGAAEQAAQRVSGVRAIVNDLRVELSPHAERTDADIAAAAVKALEWNATLPRNGITLKVDDGCITLRGRVGWQYQKVAAENELRSLQGVKGVINDMVVAPSISASDVQRSIAAALERNALLDAQHISVESHGGRLILRGSVESLGEKLEAERAAWSTPGVTDVQNELQVSAVVQ